MHVSFRILFSNLRVPLSEHDRVLLLQLDGNLRLGQNNQQHEDLSGIQVKMILATSIFESLFASCCSDAS
jgi:hypothetical protein